MVSIESNGVIQVLKKNHLFLFDEEHYLTKGFNKTRLVIGFENLWDFDNQIFPLEGGTVWTEHERENLESLVWDDKIYKLKQVSKRVYKIISSEDFKEII